MIVMVDHNPKDGENQSRSVKLNPNLIQSDTPQPIFEAISEPEEQIQPEEVSPEVTTPEEAAGSVAPPAPPPAPPMHHDSGLMKYALMAGGAIFFVVIFALLLRVLFAGKPAAAPVTLTYWGLWEEKEIYQPLIDQYQAKNPHVKINYQKMSPIDYREKLIARTKNGQGPDIFRFHNTWLPQIKEIAAYIPPSIMSSNEFEKTFYPIHSKDLKIGEYHYGIPLYIDGLVLIYNDGLFKKAGISRAPTTWEEIIEDVPKLSVKDQTGTIITAGMAIGTASNVEHFSEIFGLMLVQNGGSLKELGKPEAAGTLEAYRRLAEAPSDFWDDSMPNSIAAFVQEKVAMILAPSWQILTIKAQNPDLDLKVTAAPSLPGATPVSIASYWVEGVSKQSKNQVEAWKFLKYLSEKETLTKLYEIQSKTRLFGNPYSRVDLAGSLSQNEYVGTVIQQAKYFVSLPLVSRTYDNGLNDEIVQNIENAINASIAGTSYSQALEGPSQGIGQVLGRY